MRRSVALVTLAVAVVLSACTGSSDDATPTTPPASSNTPTTTTASATPTTGSTTPVPGFRFDLPTGQVARVTLSGADCIGCDYELWFDPDGTVAMSSEKVGSTRGPYDVDELDRLIEAMRPVAERYRHVPCDDEDEAGHRQTVSIAIDGGAVRVCANRVPDKVVPFLSYVRATATALEVAWAAETAEVEPLVIVTPRAPGCGAGGCPPVTRLFVDGRWATSDGESGTFDPTEFVAINEQYHTEEWYELGYLTALDAAAAPCRVPTLAERRYEVGFVANPTDRTTVVVCEDSLYRFQPTIAVVDDILREIAGEPPSPVDPRAVMPGLGHVAALAVYASPSPCSDCRTLTLFEDGRVGIDGYTHEFGEPFIRSDTDELDRLLSDVSIEELVVGRRECGSETEMLQRGSLVLPEFGLDFCWVDPDVAHPLFTWLDAELARVVAVVDETT